MFWINIWSFWKLINLFGDSSDCWVFISFLRLFLDFLRVDNS